MSNVNPISGSSNIYGVSDASGAGTVTSMSPDALLAYCQMQLEALDGEMKTQMNQQESALAQRTAVEGVESTLESFGDNGPQTVGDLQKCSQAFDAAIAKLPKGDPVAAQLAAQQADMNGKYGNHGKTSQLPTASLVNPPKNDEWKGTVDSASNLADGIKSDSEIQATGLMSKEDDTLDAGAKAIGQ